MCVYDGSSAGIAGMNVYVYIYIYMCVYVYIYKCMYVGMYVGMYVCVYIVAAVQALQVRMYQEWINMCKCICIGM